MKKYIIEKLNIPERCLVDKRINKDLFFSNPDINRKNKKIIREKIDNITLLYIIEPRLLNMPEQTKKGNNYSVVNVYYIKLKNENIATKQIVEAITNIIPFPLLLILQIDNQVKFCAGKYRKNLTDQSKYICEERYETDYFGLDASEKVELYLLDSMNIDNNDFTDLFRFYQGWILRIQQYRASKITGIKCTMENLDELTATLNDIEDLNLKVIEIKRKLKNEIHFNEKTRLNIEIMRLQNKKGKLVNEIK